MNKRVIWIAGGVVLGIAALAIFVLIITGNGNETQLIASGRIEGRLTTLSAKSPAEIDEIFVDEGMFVERAQPLARLEDPTQRARVAAAREQLAALRKKQEGLTIELQALERQTDLQIAQAKVAQSEATSRVTRAEADYAQAKRDFERYQKLAQSNVISQQRMEEVRLRETMSFEGLKEAEAVHNRAQKTLQLAQLQIDFIAAKRAELESLTREIGRAEAALTEQKSYVDAFSIESPLSGTVLARMIEIGERVNAGTPLFTLVDLDKLYVKVYIPEPDIGKITLGQPARIQVDSHPDRFFSAKVSKIAQQAEFTPKNVETREERVKLVFAVELSLTENPGGILKPGMPADGIIDLASADAQNSPD